MFLILDGYMVKNLKICFIRTFYNLGRYKFVSGGLFLNPSQFSLLPKLPQKNEPQFQSGQNQLENNYFD